MMRIVLCLIALMIAGPALACGPDSDCKLGDRTYRLYVPAGQDGQMGALLFAHGYRGTAAGAMRNTALRKLADDLGLALIALKSKGDDWNLAHRPRAPQQTRAAEYRYVSLVLDDVAKRMPLDDRRLVFSGFSAGGMMTWTMACGMSDRFAGFVAMSGTFWAPVPETCTTPPASIVHIHGTEDGVVPLGGRAIGPTRQGDVQTALAMYQSYGAFSDLGPGRTAPADMTCRRAANDGGKILEFCTFPGGHGFSTRRLRYGIEQVLAGR